MDHHAQQHEHHEKEREHHKKEQEAREKAAKGGLPVHPAWLMAVGIALTVLVVLVWTFLL